MQSVRKTIGGLGNLMFKQAYLWAQLRDGNIPDIYVQSEKYFGKYKNEVKQMFSYGIDRNDKVALHIRRGDYMKASEFHLDLCKTDYYQRALALFPDDTFIVFYKDRQDDTVDSSDLEWCTTFLDTIIPGRYEFCPEGTETDDLNLMASCKSIIMANSSFSWWGAYLGEHKQIICPKQWFTDNIQRCDLLEEWTKI